MEAAAHYSYGGGGTYLGEFKEDGSINIRDTHFKPLDSETVAQSRSYTTQGGETLQNLAQMFLGDKDFWYLIAALNGLDSPDEALPQGKVLHIPAQGTASNSSDAFNPINLNEVLENYLPEAAFVPPPQKGCNAVASIIMIVVAVIATIYTAGAAAGAMGAAATSAGGATVGALGAGSAVLAGGAAAGVTVAGISTAAMMGAAAIGGFVGSVASQLVGKALGAVDSFSLKDALASGLTAGATAGAGSAIQGADWAAKGVEVAGNYGLNAGTAARGAIGAAASVAANKLVGNHASFRWGNVVAAAVASGITGDTGVIGQGSLNPVNGIFNAGIRYGADKLFGNEASWNFDAVAVDAFGNAIGNALVANRIDAATTQQQAMQASDELARRASASVNEKLDGQVEQSTTASLSSAEAASNRVMWALEHNRMIDVEDANIHAESQRNERMLIAINEVNAQRDLLQSTSAQQAMQVQQRQYSLDRLAASAGAYELATTGGYAFPVTEGGGLRSQAGPWADGYAFQAVTGNAGASNSPLTEALGDVSRGIQYVSSSEAGLKFLAAQNLGLGLMARNQQALTGVDAIFGQLKLAQYSELSLTANGNALALADSWYPAFGDTAKMSTAYGAADLLNNPVVGGIGTFAGVLGPLITIGQAFDFTSIQNDGFKHSWNTDKGGLISHWTKAGVDVGFAGASMFGGLPGIAAAGVYTVTDLALSITPEYQVRYGNSAGQMVNGWEKAGFYGLDQTQSAILKAVETGVGPRGVKLQPVNPNDIQPLGRGGRKR